MTFRAVAAPFALVLGAAILLRITLALLLPFGQVVTHRLEGLNDEPAHLNYVRYLAEHRTLPIQTGHVRETGAFERGDFEYYQPPLYYLLCAPLVALAGDRQALLVCRALSLVFGLLALPVLARILARLGLGESERRAGVAFAALLPVHAYFSALVSNDSLCWLFALLITHELVSRLGQESRGGMKADLRLGVLLGAGMLTKSALAVFYPVAVLVYGMLSRRARLGRAVGGAALAVGVSLLIAGPWYTRNLALYGSVFALDVGFGPPEAQRWTLLAQAHAAAGTVRTFWFPMQHVPGGPGVVVVRWLELLLAACHTAAALWFLRRRRPLTAPEVSALALLVVVFASHIALNLRWGESEGRFLLPALGTIAYIIVAPVFALAARWKAGERLAWAYLVALALHPYVFLAFV